jgi:hypothetical protein
MNKLHKILKLKFPILEACGINQTEEEYKLQMLSITSKSEVKEQQINEIIFKMLLNNHKAFLINWKSDCQNIVSQILEISNLEIIKEKTTPNEKNTECNIEIIHKKSETPIICELSLINPEDDLQNLNQQILFDSNYLIKWYGTHEGQKAFFFILKEFESTAIKTRFIEYDKSDY